MDDLSNDYVKKLIFYNQKGNIILEEYTRNRKDVLSKYCSALEVEAREFQATYPHLYNELMNIRALILRQLINLLTEKYKEKADVCNAIGSHHDEVEMTSLLAPIVQVCDAISGARPGARRESIENYIKRLQNLEEISNGFDGVDTSFALQAGREIRVMVNPAKLSDDKMTVLAHDIKEKIENDMDYPGNIKVTVIRETRAIDYAK